MSAEDCAAIDGGGACASNVRCRTDLRPRSAASFIAHSGLTHAFIAFRSVALHSNSIATHCRRHGVRDAARLRIDNAAERDLACPSMFRPAGRPPRQRRGQAPKRRRGAARRSRSGGSASTTRCSRASSTQALQANTSVDERRGGRAPGARAARRLGGGVAAVGRRARRRRSAAARAARASATASAPASMRAGSSTSSASKRSASEGERGRAARQRREPGRRAGVGRRRGRAQLHRAARHAGPAGDRARTTSRPSTRRCRSRSGACRPGSPRRSTPSRRARRSSRRARSLPALQTSIEQTRHALAVLTGQPPAALTPLLAASGPMPQAPTTLALEFPAETLRQRPDVRAAEHQVTAAIAPRRAGRCGALSELPAQRLDRACIALTLGSLTSGASVAGLAAGQRVVAAVRRRRPPRPGARPAGRARPGALGLQRGGADRAARTSRTRSSRCAATASASPHLQLAAEAAGNAALLARQRYSSGLVDFQTVLDTQRTQLTTQDSVANATRRRQRRPRAPVQGAGRRLASGQTSTRRRCPTAQRPGEIVMNAPIPPAIAVEPAPVPSAGAGAATGTATLLDEPAPRAWYRRPALWAGVALLALAAAGALVLADAAGRERGAESTRRSRCAAAT